MCVRERENEGIKVQCWCLCQWQKNMGDKLAVDCVCMCFAAEQRTEVL